MKELIKELMINIAVVIVLFLGASYGLRVVFKVVERITVTQMKEGLTPLTDMTRQLVGDKFEPKN